MSNFWTEGNKTMDGNSLIAADMRRKLMKMSGQVVYGKDIADLCYNYDYFVVDEKKALQFISDYAEDFISSINRYEKSTGKVFADVISPTKTANLIALYKGRDIAEKCETIQKNWDNKMVLNSDSLTKIVHELYEMFPTTDMLHDRTLLDKDSLRAVAVSYLCDELQKRLGNKVQIGTAFKERTEPVLSERTVKSLLRNSYAEIAKAIINGSTNTKDFYLLVEGVVNSKAEEIFMKEFPANSRNLAVSKELIIAIKEGLGARFQPETVSPRQEQKSAQKPESIKEVRGPVREK